MGLKNKKILITCGPTWVPIDGVRVISNCSTGTLGHLLAQGLKNSGARVTLLEGPVSNSFKDKKVRVRKFIYFSQLADLLQKSLKEKFDVVIHAAAVSDYQLKNPAAAKLGSDKKELILRLTPTPKLINAIKRQAPGAFLVGFKLESSAQRLKQSSQRLAQASGCDLVVANSLTNGYRAKIFDKNGLICGQAVSRAGIAQKLIALLERNV